MGIRLLENDMMRPEYVSMDMEERFVTELVISREQLYDGTSHLFRGTDHGVPISFFWGHYPLGHGPRLHKHPFEEIHIVEEGKATFTLADSKIVVEEGHVVIVPRNTPHRFINSIDKMLRMISIHCSGKLISEYLE